jgi:hypothetical protein
MQLAHIIHRVATDPTFATAFLQDSSTAMERISASVDKDKLTTLLLVLRTNPQWVALCSPNQDRPLEMSWL